MALSTSFSTKGAKPQTGLVNRLASSLGFKQSQPAQQPSMLQSLTNNTPKTSMAGLYGSTGSANYATPEAAKKGLLPTTPEPKTAVKSATTKNVDGSQTTVTYHPEEKKTETPTTPKTSTPTPAPITPQTSAQRVIDTGQQTPLEQTATEKLYQAGQATPLEQQYIDRIQKAQGFKNVGALAPFAEAGMYAGGEPNADALITQPDLAGRAGATQGLFNNLSNIYGSQATQGLLAANTIAGRGLDAAQSGLAGAQTQAGRAQTGASTVLDATLPGQQSPTTQLYDPITGQPIQQVGGGIAGGANRQSIFDLTQQANDLTASLNGAEANFALLVDTAKQGGVNDMNVPMLNVLQQNLQRGLTSSAAVTNFRSTLAAVRQQYANILGGGSATDMSRGIAAEQIPDDISLGALQSLEQQMKAEASNRINGITQTVQSLESQGTSGSSTGGSIWDW